MTSETSFGMRRWAILAFQGVSSDRSAIVRGPDQLGANDAILSIRNAEAMRFGWSSAFGCLLFLLAN